MCLTLFATAAPVGYATSASYPRAGRARLVRAGEAISRLPPSSSHSPFGISRVAPRARAVLLEGRGPRGLLGGGGGGRRPVAVLPHQDGRQQFDCPLVEGPVVGDHLGGGSGQFPHPLGRRRGAHHDLRLPHQAIQLGPPRGPPPPRPRAPACPPPPPAAPADPARPPRRARSR